MLYILLADGAERAKKVIEDYEPMFDSKEAYFAYIDQLNTTGDRIEYFDGGIAQVKIG